MSSDTTSSMNFNGFNLGEVVSLPRLFVILLSLVTFLGFQNCSETNFQKADLPSIQENLWVFTVMEDHTLIDRPPTYGASFGQESQFELISSPKHGEILNFDPQTGEFEYRPYLNYFGPDSFTYAEDYDLGVEQKEIFITVVPENDRPWIVDDGFSFDMNTANNSFNVTADDIEKNPTAVYLNHSLADTVKTANGSLQKTSQGFTYTPDPGFRGVDRHIFVAIDNENGTSEKELKLHVGNVLIDLEPAMAIRAPACITCHANVSSKFITDFGFGSDQFFGLNGPLGSFSGNVYGDHHLSWRTANITDSIIVPNASFGSSIDDIQANSSQAIQDLFATRPQARAATTLKQYVEALESEKTTPASVIEKNQVYIGAPNAATLEQRFSISTNQTYKFVKNKPESPEVSGLDYTANQFYQATSQETLVCDGDLYIDGTLFLDGITLRSDEGCRIYTTGPIFLQKAVTYEKLFAESQSNLSNLQLVSAKGIYLGVGTSHCETGQQWYARHNVDNPLKRRIVDMWTTPSQVTRHQIEESLTPAQSGQIVVNEANKISAIEDASCHDRSIHFERLLLNAPEVHSRYQGNFKGVIVTEYPLFSLSQFKFEFDETFKAVPVLPMLQQEDFLVVK